MTHRDIEKACCIITNAQWAIYGSGRIQISKKEHRAINTLSGALHYLAAQAKLLPSTESV